MKVRPGAGRAAIAALLAVTLLNGCGRKAHAAPVDVAWTLEPATAVVGPATLRVTVHDLSGRGLSGATVRLEGHMSHPGMAPVLADARELAAGAYEIPFAFTMQGDWVLLVSVVLPDGGRTERRIDVAHVRPSGS